MLSHRVPLLMCLGVPSRPQRINHYLDRHFVSTMIVAGQWSWRLRRSFHSHPSRNHQPFSSFQRVCHHRRACSTPERIQDYSSDAAHGEYILFIRRIGIVIEQLPKHTKIAFKGDHQVVAVSSRSKPAHVGLSRRPSRHDPILIISFSHWHFVRCHEKVWSIARSIAASTP